MQDASLDGAKGDFAAIAVEQRQFSARLCQAALQIAPLRLGWPQRRRIIMIRSVAGHEMLHRRRLESGKFVSSLRLQS
jgi:hypothetical protein